jgi:hypothetical protein
LTAARAAHSKATAKLDKLRREAGEKQDTLMRAQRSSDGTSGASQLPLTLTEYSATGSSSGAGSAAAAANSDTVAAGNSSTTSGSSTAATPAVAALGATIGETTAQVIKQLYSIIHLYDALQYADCDFYKLYECVSEHCNQLMHGHS